MVIHPSWQLFGFSRGEFDKMDTALGDVGAVFEPWSPAHANPTLVHAKSVDQYVASMETAKAEGRNPTAVAFIPKGVENVPTNWVNFDEVVSASSRSWLRSIVACPFVIGLRAHTDIPFQVLATLYWKYGEDPADWPLDLLPVDQPVLEHLKVCAVYKTAWNKMIVQRLRSHRTEILAFSRRIVAVEIGVSASLTPDKVEKSDKSPTDGRWKLFIPTALKNALRR